MCRVITPEKVAPAVDRIGTTLMYSCTALSAHVSVDFDLKSNQLRVYSTVGDFVYSSEWLRVKPFSENPASALHILQALEQWRELVTTQSIGLPNSLKPIMVIAMLWEVIEHILAEIRE